MRKTLCQALTMVAVVPAWITVCCSSAEPAQDKPAADTLKATSGEAAVKQAAEAKKHLYMFFYSEDNEATREARKSFDASVAKMADVAQCVALDRAAPEQKALVEKYGLTAAPMPLVLVLAPNGAITMGCLAQDMNEEKLREGITGPAQQECLKALQDNKIVVVCAYDKTIGADDPSVKAVNDFHADAKYAKLTEVVRVDPADAAESRFLKQLGLDSTSKQVTVILGPPRVLVKKFIGAVAKAEIEGALKSGAG